MIVPPLAVNRPTRKTAGDLRFTALPALLESSARRETGGGSASGFEPSPGLGPPGGMSRIVPALLTECGEEWTSGKIYVTLNA